MTDSLVPVAQKLTRGLIDFLVEITEAAERTPELDIFRTNQHQPWHILWLEELPADAGKTDLTSEVLFRMRPPVAKSVPPPPDLVRPWLDASFPWNIHTNEPRIHESGAVAVLSSIGSVEAEEAVGPTEESRPPHSVVREFERWLATWHVWAEEQHRVERLREIYTFLEDAAKEVEQRDDENELVLAQGLVRWITPDGRTLRRHLVTEQMLPALNRRTAEVTITRIGAARRYEDSQLFGEVDGYQHDRAQSARETLDDALERGASEEHCLQLLGEWISRCVGTDVQAAPPLTHYRELGPRLEVSAAPALILRPRSKVLLAEAYKRIARELRDPNTPVPVALAQLVIDTEAEQRQQWIELQHGVTGDFLGDDPRFPLDVNPEQERVMELLRTESSVVVQGPPGTGKTHTIANLVSALLARGQRVLVTSQKDQALRVLREKIPQELRHLCVLLAGGSKDAAVELQQGLDALSEAVATSDRGALRRRAEACTDERVRLRSEAARLNAEIRDLRETENKRHAPVAPWYSNTAYSGTLSDIVRNVKLLEPLYGWFPPSSSETFTGPPSMKAQELLQLRHLLVSDSNARRARNSQWIPGAREIPSLGEFAELVAAERTAKASAGVVETPVSRQLAALGPERLTQLTPACMKQCADFS